MSTVLASTLSETPVMRADGKTLGTVRTVIGNVATGELEHVLVDPPDEEVVYGFERADDGTIRIPAARISGLDDYLIVDGDDSAA